MPIYEYYCNLCGFAKDLLQKVSDKPPTTCPSCKKLGFKKKITAAGFKLKGTGWYSTDFRDGTTTTNSVEPSKDSKLEESKKSPTTSTDPKVGDVSPKRGA